MMVAASMGATAFQKGLGAIHAVSHPVGAVYNTHHGMTNACVMPMVLDMNEGAIADRLASAAAYMGIEGGYQGFRGFVMDLRAELNVPENLRAMGVGDDRIDEMVDAALQDPSCGGNPVEMTRDNTMALFHACLD